MFTKLTVMIISWCLSQIIMLYTLNVYSVVLKLYLNKTGEEKRIFFIFQSPHENTLEQNQIKSLEFKVAEHVEGTQYNTCQLCACPGG